MAKRRRRHTNRDGRKQIRLGRTRNWVRKIARRLGIPVSHPILEIEPIPLKKPPEKP